MAAPRKETTRRTSKAAVEAQASTAAAETVPDVEVVEGQLPIAETPVVEDPAPVEKATAEEAPAAETPVEAPAQDARASLLAKFVNPEAPAAPVQAKAPASVPKSGNSFALPAGEEQELIEAICVVDLFVVRNEGITYQLFKGDTITAPAELLARGFKFEALAELD